MEITEKIAKSESWAVLLPVEYHFARKALRGGRTDVRKLYHAITPEQHASGERICYQDICSEYPFQQVEHDFPVGIPEIRIYDEAWRPCIHKVHNDDACLQEGAGLRGIKGGCRHSRGEMLSKQEVRLNIKHHFGQQPSISEMMSRDFFGIVCASVTPPVDLYHPVLVQYDDDAMKCISSCEPIKEGFFTSVELQCAIERGYTIDKIHRFDKYTRAPSLWRDTTIKLFIEKMVNSRDRPGDEEAEEMIAAYERKFGIGAQIAATFRDDKWGRNPAKKQTAKIMMNSVWGKHAEKPIQEECKFFSLNKGNETVYTFYDNVFKGNYELNSQIILSGDTVMYKYKVTDKIKFDATKGYLPAAVFVPAYGRLQLEAELFKLGKRVLMNDTDSIVYHYIPGQYNIPEGSLLGDWEVEDIDSKNGGIAEFAGIGPKTYAVRTFENEQTLVKAKGLSLKHATGKLVNFNSMRRLVMNQIRDGNSRERIRVPQTSFVFTVDAEMRTYRYLKDLRLDKSALKGRLVGPYLYPYGYQDASEPEDRKEDQTRVYA